MARVELSLMARLPWDGEADAARRRGRAALEAAERRVFHERLGSADVRRSIVGPAEGLAAAPGAEARRAPLAASLPDIRLCFSFREGGSSLL